MRRLVAALAVCALVAPVEAASLKIIRRAAASGPVCSIDFDGSDDYMESTTAAVTAPPLTICAWYKVDSTYTSSPSQITIAAVDVSASANNQFFLELNDTDTGGAEVGAVTRGTSTVRAIATATISADTWQHGCAVITSSSSRAAFMNGTNKGTNSTARAASGMDRTRVGARASAGGIQNPFNGKIAHVAFWNVALTDTEVANLAGGDNPLTAGDNGACTGSTTPYACCTGSGTGTCTGPVAYYPFTTGSAGTDEAGSIDLTSYGSPATCTASDIPTVDAAP